MNNNGNIVLHQIQENSNSYAIKELIPNYVYCDKPTVLIKQGDTSIFWKELDLSLNLIEDNRIKNTDIYYIDGRIGLGRSPLFTYKIDIAIPKNITSTAFHIGDGSYGFSMGNGTSNGFIPEIIGVGSDENDAGLYLVAIAGNEESSKVPLIILDGRDKYSKKLSNRPIFGITSGNYSDCCVVVDSSYNLNVRGNIYTLDIILGNFSLLQIIKKLQDKVAELTEKMG